MTLALGLSMRTTSCKSYDLTQKTPSIRDIFTSITELLDQIPADSISVSNGGHVLFVPIDKAVVKDGLDNALKKLSKGWFPALRKSNLDNTSYAKLDINGQRVHTVLSSYRKAVEVFAREIGALQTENRDDPGVLKKFSEIRRTFLRYGKELDQVLRKQIPEPKTRALVKRILLWAIPLVVGISIALSGPGLGLIAGSALAGALILSATIGFSLTGWEILRAKNDKPWDTFKSAINDFLTHGRATDQELVSQMLLISAVNQQHILGRQQDAIQNLDSQHHDAELFRQHIALPQKLVGRRITVVLEKSPIMDAYQVANIIGSTKC